MALTLGKPFVVKQSRPKVNTLPTIKLGKSRSKRPKNKALSILTSTKTTAVLGVTLAALLAVPAAGVAAAGAGARVALTAGARQSLAGSARVAAFLAKKAATKPIQSLAIAGVVASGAVPSIAKTTFTAGKTAGQVITGEKALTKDTVGELVKGAGVALGLGAVAAGSAVVIGTAAKALKNKPAKTSAPQEIKGLNAGSPITPTPPITPETVSIEDTTPSIKPTQAQQPTIKNNIKINVDTSKRYLNQVLVH